MVNLLQSMVLTCLSGAWFAIDTSGMGGVLGTGDGSLLFVSLGEGNLTVSFG